jgi:hypothetical protein
MNREPRTQKEYDSRQTKAAHRVLVDVAQVLAAFEDCLVLVGGWVPDLLLPDAEEQHVGSIDVDLALDAEKLKAGRYAELLGQLFNTGRYRPGTEAFQLLTDVDLGDGDAPVQVQLDFLAPKEAKLKKNRPKLLSGFRVQKADACGNAFRAPVSIEIVGRTPRGAENRVRVRVASVEDFLVMKAHALAGRDKPKDSYDFCYCLDHYPGGLGELAAAWRNRAAEKDVKRAIEILREKFASPRNFGPDQVVQFFDSPDAGARAMQARRAFELVQQLLDLIRGGDPTGR